MTAQLAPTSALKLQELPDLNVVEYVAMAEEELRNVQTILREQINAGKAELERRMIERGAKAIPHPTIQVELVEEFTPYNYDVDKLAEAAKALPDTERAKVIKHIPEQVTIVPEHWEPGNPRSITALRERYAGTPVSDLLGQAMQRQSLGTKLVIKPRK